jgi:TolA-binding protein
MSPKAVQYKTNSIIYFKGDLNEKVFILKGGRVNLVSNDIETGQEIHDMIQTGEFFGVKSALGKYPREETAMVLQDASVIAFSVPEFEQLVLQNTRIIMKMLKVFSNQLRRTHKQVQNLLNADTQGENPESGLFKIGEYYLKNKKYPQALYVFRRYLTYYPSGKHAQEVPNYIAMAEGKAQNMTVSPPPASLGTSGGEGGSGSTGQMSDVAKEYYNAVSLFSQQKFSEALVEFRKILNNSGDEEYVAKSMFEMGRCYFSTNDFDQCIKQFTMLIQKYPKHPDLMDGLLYVGNCYEKKGENERAVSFYNKILKMSPPDSSAYRKAKKAINKLEAG